MAGMTRYSIDCGARACAVKVTAFFSLFFGANGAVGMGRYPYHPRSGVFYRIFCHSFIFARAYLVGAYAHDDSRIPYGRYRKFAFAFEMD